MSGQIVRDHTDPGFSCWTARSKPSSGSFFNSCISICLGSRKGLKRFEPLVQWQARKRLTRERIVLAI